MAWSPPCNRTSSPLTRSNSAIHQRSSSCSDRSSASSIMARPSTTCPARPSASRLLSSPVVGDRRGQKINERNSSSELGCKSVGSGYRHRRLANTAGTDNRDEALSEELCGYVANRGIASDHLLQWLRQDGGAIPRLEAEIMSEA